MMGISATPPPPPPSTPSSANIDSLISAIALVATLNAEDFV